MAMQDSDSDVVIIGAGPSGLALACALGGSGLCVTIVERQSQASLEHPAFDGREIALTHRSAERLQGLGAWARLPEADVAPLGEARVLSGHSLHALRFDPGPGKQDVLGFLVPNHLIRRVLFETAMTHSNVRLMAGLAATGIATSQASASLTLADGTRLRSRLIVAADTRFSEMRRRMGLPVSMRDFGKSMLVCRMTHELPHGDIATEWFGYGQTLATLPLNDIGGTHCSSMVVTLPARETERLMALDDIAFAAEITQRYDRRLGEMSLASTRHAYPLVATYASRFVADRFALVGDAAVGMHPVTAHGFNFGLSSADTLARLAKAAASSRKDIAAPSVLRRYELAHRRATRLLYLATNTTALLYADDRLPARLLRHAVIRAGEKLPPMRRMVVAQLMAGRGKRSGRLPPAPQAILSGKAG
jgi:ubiquinone biosynthesis UbiH/UbiF/VisC/COQ6 family hydroxylase